MKRIAPDAGPDGPEADPMLPENREAAEREAETVRAVFGREDPDWDEEDDVPPDA